MNSFASGKVPTIQPIASLKVTNAPVAEILTYAFSRKHRRRIRTNNVLERMIWEIRRRTRVVGHFPDGQSALMLPSAT